MKKLKLKKVILRILLITVLGGIGYITRANIINKENTRQIEQLNKPQQEAKKEYDKRVAHAKAIEDAKVEETQPANIPLQVIEEAIIYRRMHEMINTKIIAADDHVYPEIPITAKVCDEMITNITASSYVDKKVLLNFLAHWKKGDFKSGIYEHNYLWGKLGETLGKAGALR